MTELFDQDRELRILAEWRYVFDGSGFPEPGMLVLMSDGRLLDWPQFREYVIDRTTRREGGTWPRFNWPQEVETFLEGQPGWTIVRLKKGES